MLFCRQAFILYVLEQELYLDDVFLSRRIPISYFICKKQRMRKLETLENTILIKISVLDDAKHFNSY